MKRLLTALLILIPAIAHAQYGGDGAYGSVSGYLGRINVNPLPAADNTYWFGSATKRWQSITTVSLFFGNGTSMTTAATAFATAGSGSELQARSTATTVQAVTGSATSGGNLGIGTTLTTNKLTVGSNASIGATYAGASAPANGLIVQGNVGIGSSAPGAFALDVAGTERVTGISNSTTAITNSAAYTQSGTSANTLSGTTTFSHATLAALFPTGNVGINSASPGTKLDVKGPDSTYTSMRLTNLDGDGGVQLQSGSAAAGTRNYLVTANLSESGAFDIKQGNAKGDDPESSGTLRFKISLSGNVGIGTSVPGAMLDVSDGIRSVKGAAVGVGACWCTTPPKVLGYCTGALGTCSACNYNGSGC